ncbi:hypothetical protein QYF36_014685 [Acer negundo]|nr:hypothetical protein QYF36_014685 [Acer negundo]
MMEDEEVTTPITSATNTRVQAPGERPRAWVEGRQVTHVIQSHPSTISRHRKSGNLKRLLIACAKSLNENNINDFDNLIEKARGAVSISGEPIQRLGAYLVEGLVARKEKSGSNIYRALRCREPEGKDLLSYMHILYEICPYLKFGYMAANGAIAEACRNEDRIHIIDFQIDVETNLPYARNSG